MSRFLPITVLLLAACLSAAADGTAPPTAPPPPGERLPVHADAKDLEQAMQDAMLGMTRGSRTDVRAAFDRAEKDCRRMTHAEDKIWIRDMVNQDMAMHAALDHARTSATSGDFETAMESVQWIVRTCRDCHKLRPH